MLVLCYPKCSTCRKAIAWLESQNIPYTYRDIQADNPTADELSAWISRSNLPVKRFFNTSGLQYRALGLKDKLEQMTAEEQIQLLATDGMLVKRPLVITDTLVLPGFREAEWAAWLKNT